MKKSSTVDAEVARFRSDIQDRLKGRVREAIELVLEEELTEALGSGRYERQATRRGYRNGKEERELTTANGVQELRVPRGRVAQEDGSTKEFRSEVVPRYARRTQEVDEAILGAYLAGANTRRIRKALRPLLGESHLSKSAISRVVGKVKKLFAEWSERDLSQELYALLYLDAFHLKVRLARRVVSVPVLAALGVTEDGSKRLVSLRLAMSEASRSWESFVRDLKERGLPTPALLVTDGHGGLKKAGECWPGVEVQRCTRHKWRNLAGHCPRHAHAELRRDYTAIIYAKDAMAARAAHHRFLDKWQKLCPPVARSLEEAGEQLLTFYRFPKAMWKSLRTTNPLENLNREFRRRTKTQGSFPNDEAALALLFGLIASGQIMFRRITGYQHVAKLLRTHQEQAA